MPRRNPRDLYKLVHADSLLDLEIQVERYLEKGYVPCGGPFSPREAHCTQENFGYHAQAVWKAPPIKENK